MNGTVKQLNRKPQTPGEPGLPKLEVNVVSVSEQGMDGDYNRFRQENRNGDPSKALLIMPSEMLGKLNEEGWPIQPGDLGENITSSGIEYDNFQIGEKYKVGEAVIKITEAATPCIKLKFLPYVGEAKFKEFIKTLVNRRGWYAAVIQNGVIKKGDGIKRLL